MYLRLRDTKSHPKGHHYQHSKVRIQNESKTSKPPLLPFGPAITDDCPLHVKIWVHLEIKKKRWDRGKKWSWGRNEMTCPNDREQGSGVECNRNESKGQWLHKIYLSYLPNAALMRIWRKKTCLMQCCLFQTFLCSPVFSSLYFRLLQQSRDECH